MEYNTDDMYWYLKSSVANESGQVPPLGFGSAYTTIRSHDILTLTWSEPNEGQKSVTGLSVYCLLCDARKNSTRSGVWQSCITDTAFQPNAATYSSSNEDNYYFTDTRGRFNMTIPEPANFKYEPSLSYRPEGFQMVCMSVLLLNKTMTWGLGAYPMILGQLFIATYQPRLGVPFTDERYLTYLYDSEHPMGSNSQPDDGYPLQNYTRYALPPIGRDSSTWNSWTKEKQAGSIIAIVIGAILVLFLTWRRFSKAPFTHAREKQRPMLLSELRRQQAQERDAATTTPVAARRSAETQHSADAVLDAEEGEAAPKAPPAYHEVVNDQERLLAQAALRRSSDNPAPVYSPPPTAGAVITEPELAMIAPHGTPALPDYSPPVAGSAAARAYTLPSGTEASHHESSPDVQGPPRIARHI